MPYNYAIELAKYFLVSQEIKGREEEKNTAKEKIEKKEPEKLYIPIPKPHFTPIPPIFKGISKQQFPRFQTRENDFDLARINTFILDPSVTLIQCDGPRIPLKINKSNEMIQTDMVLSEDEINKIINKFSLRSQVPISEPVFQAQVQDLKIMAIISKHVGSRFIISRVA